MMGHAQDFVLLVACFATCGAVASANISEIPVKDLPTHQRARALTNVTDEIPDQNWTTLSEALDIFNVRHLAHNWTEGKYPIQEECARDITRYIEGLKKKEGWALKGEKQRYIRDSVSCGLEFIIPIESVRVTEPM